MYILERDTRTTCTYTIRRARHVRVVLTLTCISPWSQDEYRRAAHQHKQRPYGSNFQADFLSNGEVANAEHSVCVKSSTRPSQSHHLRLSPFPVLQRTSAQKKSTRGRVFSVLHKYIPGIYVYTYGPSVGTRYILF